MSRSLGRSRILLIEGLPGSGKTSLAEWVHDRLDTLGLPVTLIPELHPRHPVIDRATRQSARLPDYAKRCVERWRGFAKAALASGAPSVYVVEGCLFQSAVRFLVEYERSQAEIDAYLPAVEEALVPLRPRLIYLTQTDARAYFEQEFARRKSPAWIARMAAYSATTPFARLRGLDEASVLAALYTHYRAVCDRLVERSGLARLQLDAVRFDEAAIRERVGAWLESALPA